MKLKPTMLPFKRPKRHLTAAERGLPLGQHRAAVATIKHDLKTGRLEHARFIASRIIDGDLSQHTPVMLRTILAQVEVELDKAGL